MCGLEMPSTNRPDPDAYIVLLHQERVRREHSRSSLFRFGYVKDLDSILLTFRAKRKIEPAAAPGPLGLMSAIMLS